MLTMAAEKLGGMPFVISDLRTNLIISVIAAHKHLLALNKL